MATLHSAIGEISGKVGRLVYKRYNGKIVVCSRPIRRTAVSESEKARHKIFGFITKVSSAINRNPLLKMLWPQKGSFAEICKVNFKKTSPTSPDYFPIIIPNHGFIISNAKISLSEKSIMITASPLGECIGIDKKVEKWIAAAGVLIFMGKNSYGPGKIMAAPITSGKQIINVDEPISFEIQIYGTVGSYFRDFEKTIAAFTIVTLNENSLPVQYSDEFNGVI